MVNAVILDHSAVVTIKLLFFVFALLASVFLNHFFNVEVKIIVR